MPGYHFKENDYLHIMQSYNRIFEPNHVMPRIHRHVGIEIMYVLSGKAIVRMYDEAGAQTEQYKLSSGDFFFLESDRFHQLFTSDCVTRIVNLELAPAKEQQFAYQRTVGQIIKGNRRLADLFSESQTFRLFDNGELLYILMMILRRFPDRAEKYGELEALLVVLFAEVADLYRQSERQYRGYAYVKRAVNEIENDVSVCTPDSLAEMVGVSRVYLQKLFRLCFSMGVAEYINYFRCTRARGIRSQTGCYGARRSQTTLPSATRSTNPSCATLPSQRRACPSGIGTMQTAAGSKILSTARYRAASLRRC